MVEMNSSTGMQVFFSMSIHFFVMLCTARSRGMFVNSEVASNENNMSCLCIVLSEKDLYKIIVDMPTIGETIRDNVMLLHKESCWYNDSEGIIILMNFKEIKLR